MKKYGMGRMREYGRGGKDEVACCRSSDWSERSHRRFRRISENEGIESC